MKRVLIILAIIAVCVGGGILVVNNLNNSTDIEEVMDDSTDEEATEVAGHSKIDPAEAKRIMDGGDPYILLDVRTAEEFADEHIAGATLIPSDEILERATTELPDKNALIMVYCRSGVRSAAVVDELVEMGYTNIHDLGGIIDWPYEVVAKTNQ